MRPLGFSRFFPISIILISNLTSTCFKSKTRRWKNYLFRLTSYTFGRKRSLLWRFNHLLIIKSRKKFKVTKSKRYIVRKEIMGTSEKIRSGYLLYRTCIFSIIVIIFKLVMLMTCSCRTLYRHRMISKLSKNLFLFSTIWTLMYK